MTEARSQLRSQRLRFVNHQGDALRLGMNWTEEDLGKPQVLLESSYGHGHPEMHYAAAILSADPVLNMTTAIVTDGRYSGAMRGPCTGHVARAAIDGGPIGLVADGDPIGIDAPRRRLDIVGTAGERCEQAELEATLAQRRRIFRPPRPRYECGILSLYSRVARAASHGASII
jgi:dihydroxy-acid dehydratase